MEPLTIAGRRVADGEPPFIVAEIGSNHDGDMDLCRRLVLAARDAGADAVKFQSWSKASLVSRAELARNTRYVRAEGNGAPTLEEAIERYQLSPDQHREIAAFCRDAGIVFFSSCFSEREVDLLASLDVPAFKIASMDVNHLPLLRYVAATGRPVILSTGMASLGEVERALDTLRQGGAGAVALLHCVSSYPTAPADVHLRNMETLRCAFGVPVGYSDHALGNAVALAAVALGACMIEKHFTVDKALPGWDHGISADPPELRALTDGARKVHAALGSPRRQVDAAQLEKRKAFRRRAVAARALPAGSCLSESDLAFKRPGTGIAPDETTYVIGRRLTRDVGAEEELSWTDIA